MSETIVTILLAVVFALLGVAMLLGKGDFMIKRHYLESGKYNIVRLRIIHALTFFLVVVVSILSLLGVNEFVTVCVILPAAIVLAVLQYTWARR